MYTNQPIKKNKIRLTQVKDHPKETIQISSFAFLIFNKSSFEAKTNKIFI